MASCDDDFSLLSGDAPQSHHHHRHQSTFAPNRFAHKPQNPHRTVVAGEDHDSGEGDDYGDNAFCSQTAGVNSTLFAAADDDDDNNNSNHHLFVPPDEDESDRKSLGARICNEKRKDPCGEDLSDSGGGEGSYFVKKPKISSPAAGSADYRKDREEWSDSAIGCLLDAYTEKFEQLNRGNLRGRDWEAVASIVSGRSDKQKTCKSVEQCKNKVDNLKKRYKAERQRLTNGSLSVSHWPWFKKMEQIVGSSPSSKTVSDEDKSVVGGGGVVATRQTRRYAVASPSNVGLANNLRTKSFSNTRWRRVVFKITGAALAGNSPQNVDPKVTTLIAREVATASRLGVEVAIVVGGSNFFSGDTWVATTGLDRSTAYQIGMMATVMNSILLQASLEKLGVQTRVQTAFTMQEIAEPYIRRRAIRHLEKGRVVIFGGIGAGSGNPLFTTDTAAALRASEINADVLLKGANLDGVYDCHARNSNNGGFEHISYREFVPRGINNSMDMTAMQFCQENNIPVVIFDLFEPGIISRALCGDQVGTLIDQSGRIS